MKDSVDVHMNASPATVWSLVSDVTRIGEFSPETFEAQWLGGASAPAVGVRFRGHVKRNGRGPVYWTTCEITACEPEKEFGFSVLAGDRVTNTWRYSLTPREGGTEVTESFELPRTLALRAYWALAGRWRARTNREGMRTTLERIRAVVE